MDTMMTFSLSGIRLNSKNLKVVEQFLDEEISTDVPDTFARTSTISDIPQKKSKKMRSVEQSVENTPLPTNVEPEPEPEEKIEQPKNEPKVSLEQIVNKTRELVQANKSAAIKKCLGKYEVSRVSDIPEEKYNDFYNDINNL